MALGVLGREELLGVAQERRRVLAVLESFRETVQPVAKTLLLHSTVDGGLLERLVLEVDVLESCSTCRGVIDIGRVDAEEVNFVAGHLGLGSDRSLEVARERRVRTLKKLNTNASPILSSQLTITGSRRREDGKWSCLFELRANTPLRQQAQTS